MKVGDLVELSKAGIRRTANSMCLGGWGIIVSIDVDEDFPFKCQWFNKSGDVTNHNCDDEYAVFKAYELKKYKPDKK